MSLALSEEVIDFCQNVPTLENQSLHHGRMVQVQGAMASAKHHMQLRTSAMQQSLDENSAASVGIETWVLAPRNLELGSRLAGPKSLHCCLPLAGMWRKASTCWTSMTPLAYGSLVVEMRDLHFQVVESHMLRTRWCNRHDRRLSFGARTLVLSLALLLHKQTCTAVLDMRFARPNFLPQN